MSTRRDFLKVLGAALGVAVVPPVIAAAAEACRTDGEIADLIDKALGKREAYAVSTIRAGWTDWEWSCAEAAERWYAARPLVIEYRTTWQPVSA